MSQVENVIRVRDLFAELVRKCWLIIVCVLFFAIALGGLAVFENAQAKKSQAEAEIVETPKEDLEELEEDYRQAVLTYEGLVEYFEKSIWLSCNPYEVYQTELRYVISNISNEEDTASIRTSYHNYVTLGRLFSDMYDADHKYEERYLSEVIKIDVEGFNNKETLRTFSVIIYAKDAKQSAYLAKSVQKQMMKFAESLGATVGIHELALLETNTTEIIRRDLLTYRDDIRNNRNSWKDTVANREAALEQAKIGQVVQEEVEEKSVVKYLFLGAVVGGAVSVVIIIALYFFTNQVKTEEELEYLYEIKHLGNCAFNKKNVFEKLADKLFYKDKNFNLDENIIQIFHKIKDICEQNSIGRIGLVGSANEKEFECIEALKALLKNENIELMYTEELEDVPFKDAVFVVSIRRTLIQDVEVKMNSYKEEGLRVQGYITFSK